MEWLGLVCLAVLGAIVLVFDASERAWCVEMRSQWDQQQQVEKVGASPPDALLPASCESWAVGRPVKGEIPKGRELVSERPNEGV